MILQIVPILYLVFLFYGAGFYTSRGAQQQRSRKARPDADEYKHASTEEPDTVRSRTAASYVSGITDLFKYKQSLTEDNAAFLTPEQSRTIQAAACIGVILHHLTQRAAYRGPVTFFYDAGFLFTGLFFLTSGYGLMISVREKPGYLKGFLRKRLPAVLVPFWVINLIGLLSEWAVHGNHDSALTAFCRVAGLFLINSHSWYIIEIVCLYLIFYLLFRLISNQDLALILLNIAVGLLVWYSFLQGHAQDGSKTHWFRGEWWYNSTIAFIPGLWYARFWDKVNHFFRKYSLVLLPVFAGAFLISFRAAVRAVRIYGYYQGVRSAEITYACQTAASLTFCVFVLLLNTRIRLGNRALTFVSGLRMELFLIHGYFVHLVYDHFRMPDILRYALVLAASLACAAALASLLRMLVRWITDALYRPEKSYQTLESEIAGKKRKQRIKILCAAGALSAGTAATVLCFPLISRYIFAEKEWEEECRRLRTAAIGDEVFLGHYETDLSKIGEERLVWLVIRREGDQVCLLSKEGIAGGCYHQKHEEITWEDSDLRRLLNSGDFLRIFSPLESEHIVERDEDRLTLLTVKEAQEVFGTDQERELSITDAARMQGTNINIMSKANEWDMKGYRSSWWWLRGERGEKDIHAPIVTVDGTIATGQKAVNKPKGAIRPVVWMSTGDNGGVNRDDSH